MIRADTDIDVVTTEITNAAKTLRPIDWQNNQSNQFIRFIEPIHPFFHLCHLSTQHLLCAQSRQIWLTFGSKWLSSVKTQYLLILYTFFNLFVITITITIINYYYY